MTNYHFYTIPWSSHPVATHANMYFTSPTTAVLIHTLTIIPLLSISTSACVQYSVYSFQNCLINFTYLSVCKEIYKCSCSVGCSSLVEAAAAHKICSHRRNNRRQDHNLPGHVRNYTCLLNLSIKIRNQLNPC
jgi:hypothetical protein